MYWDIDAWLVGIFLFFIIYNDSNGTHLNVLPVNNVGSSLELTLVFNSYTLTPLLVNRNLRYEPPRLTRQDPLRGPTYGETPLFIAGVNLGDYLAERSPEDLIITIGNRSCTKFIHYDAMDFSCQVPAGRGKAQPLRVMAGGNIGLPTTTYAYDAPSITSITPTTGPLRGNISMTIQGQNFGTDLSDSDTVTIGGRLCPIEFTSFRTIICRVPAGIGGTLNVNVTILDQSAIASQKFSYDAPILDSVFPNKLSNNESFAILKGRNLGNNTSQIVIQLRHPNGTVYSACSSVSIPSGEPENGIINCTLATSLPRPVNFRVIANVAGQLSSEVVTLETGSSNLPPSVVSQALFIDEDSSVTFQLNASDADNPTVPLAYYIVRLPNNGSLLDRGSNISTTATPIIMDAILQSVLTSRYLLYVPDNEFNGMDNLIFRACDQFTCATNDGMITFNVTSVNDPPIAFNQTITMYEDASVGITLNFSDIDSNVENCSITLKTLPPGKISTNDTTEIKTVPYRLASSYLVYTSPQNAAGPPPNFVFANFTFVVSDGISSSTIGVIYLQILPVDDIPLSKDLAVSIDENTDALIQLVCTDIDTVPSALYIMITRLPENGTLYQHTDAGRGPPILGRVDDGQLWFAPSRNYIGQSSFSYECRDIFGVTSRSARVNISVNPGLACVKQLDLSFDFLLGNSDVFSITLMRDIAVEGVTFEIVENTTHGRLVNQNQEVIQAGTELTTRTIFLTSARDGGRNPYDKFSYIARGPGNTSSKPCSVDFTVNCPPSTFLNNFNYSGNACAPCPGGAVCSANGQYEPYATQGFWRAPNDVYLPCYPVIACPGLQNGTCAEGYKGIRCARCELGHYKFSQRCLKCSEDTQRSTILILLTVAAGAMSLLVLSKAKMSGASFGIINLTINFMQTILIIRNFQLEWPEQLMAVVDMVAIVNFNIEYAGPECFSDLYVFDYPLKMKISLLIPFALIGVVGLCAATWAGISKLNRLIRKTKVQESDNYQLISGVKFYNVLLSVTFITVAQNSLALFDCTYEADGNYYLDADPSLICFQDWWYRDLGIAIAAVLLYVFGIPVYFFMIYYTSQQAKYTGPTWTRLKNFSTKILHADRLFHPQHQYFVFIQFMQKIVFVLINMFFTRYVAVQSTLMLYVLLVLFYVYHTKKPYLHPILNILESLSLALSLVVLTLGLLFRTDTLRTTEQRLMVTLFILVLVFGFVFMAVCAAIYDFQVRVKDYVRNRTGSNLSMFRRSISSAKRIID